MKGSLSSKRHQTFQKLRSFLTGKSSPIRWHHQAEIHSGKRSRRTFSGPRWELKKNKKKKKCSPTSICVPSDIQGSTCIISKLLKTLRSNFHNTVHPLKLYYSMALVYLKVAQPPPLFNSSIFSSLQKVIPYPLYAPCSQPGATTNLNAGSIDFPLLCISRAIWGIL